MTLPLHRLNFVPEMIAPPMHNLFCRTARGLAGPTWIAAN